MILKSIYIASTQPESGSFLVTIGIMEMLKSSYGKVAFFRPVIKDGVERDNDIEFMIEHYSLDMEYDECYGYKVSDFIDAHANATNDELCKMLIGKVNKLYEQYDFVLIEGYTRNQIASSFDFDLNLKIAKNLNTLYLPVISAKDKTIDEVINETHIVAETIDAEGCIHLATFINRCDITLLPTLKEHLQTKANELIFLLPEVKELDTPTLRMVRNALGARMILGHHEQLQHLVTGKKIAAMSVDHYLEHINTGDLVIVPGDRIDIIAASLVSFYAKNHPNIAGIILSGGLTPSPYIMGLLRDFNEIVVPIFTTQLDSYEAAIAMEKVKVKIMAHGTRKISLAKGIFDNGVNKELLAKRFKLDTPTILTPMMFEYRLFQRARGDLQRIVLPESSDERILRAAEILIHRDIVQVILLGKQKDIYYKSSQLGLDVSKATIINHEDPVQLEIFAQRFYEMRKERGLTLRAARDAMANANYFATMMVQEGMADGMVSGAIHTTAETIRPALQIIKTVPNVSLVSSIFFMCLDTRVLVYGDCAINQSPNAEELSQIAIESAQTAKQFGIEPKIAMLSYATGGSGSGPEVDKVREATLLAIQHRPDLLIEGPIQYDAAIDPTVATQKLPQSLVAGKATVFIFPDLNTGNNTYKAVQRSTGALAIGPILQGLRKPVNDLSRGCTVDDIVNTVAITAIQAQKTKGNQ